MTKQWRFYLVKEDSEVEGTDSLEIAAIAKRDGATIVIEPGTAEVTIDGDVVKIEAAENKDWDLEDEGND